MHGGPVVLNMTKPVLPARPICGVHIAAYSPPFNSVNKGCLPPPTLYTI